jgi:uracil-DNA glycosylase family 4
MKEELLNLTRQLRRRAQQSHESDFASAKADAAAANAVPKDSANAVQPISAMSPVAGGKAAAFTALAEKVEACRACPLGSARIKSVYGVGSVDAEVLFVGEGPGFEEDHRGEPFVGKSGQLLDRIIESIGLSRQTVYIANIVKCHPMIDPSDPEKRSNDRPPTPEEIEACRGYLDDQIRIIGPKVIVTLGAVAARVLLGPGEPITKIRGQWKEYKPRGMDATVKLLPTFHPAALLRNPNLKKDVWTDMKNLRAELSA